MKVFNNHKKINNIFTVLKNSLVPYKPGREYRVKLSDIHITQQFARTKICKDKYKRKWQFYHRNGYCESKIVLNKDFKLLDGYSSYKIYRAAEGEL